MDYTDYYAARDILCDVLRKDLLGPVQHDEIIYDERPLEYYILGKLYPQKPADLEIPSETDLLQSPSEDMGELDSDAQDAISLCNSNYPSSCGISFCTAPGVRSFTVIVNAARYRGIVSQVDVSSEKKDLKTTSWKREELPKFQKQIYLEEPPDIKNFSVTDGLELSVVKHPSCADGRSIFTVSLVNRLEATGDYKEDCCRSFFQPEIRITADRRASFSDMRQQVSLDNDPEIRELEMLYSHKKNFASGHGCAADWKLDENGEATELRTEFLPFYEVCQMKPSAAFSGEILSMKFLGEADSSEVIPKAEELVNAYSAWIKRQKAALGKMPGEYREAGEKNLLRCEETMKRLRSSINSLSDPIVFKAFSLANRAMFEQRKQMLKISGKFEKDEAVRWYPFQLAFFLQEIYSFACPRSKERELVDLLWFPTGGGKTEAYLGIAAFVIFLRRLKKEENGVTVLMRYTLRLLSFQQFERASALICACELIRKRENIPGGEIGIGLWVGSSLTPNKLKDAIKYLDNPESRSPENANPVQIKKCPWCGGEIRERDYHCDISRVRMEIRCANQNCPFSTGLPVYLIDEEIYQHTPSYLVSTVDKFAQLALNEQTFSLFGGSSQDRHPPELIIQDELHLISGPLGTITGLYEAAIHKLCEVDGIPAKIVASSATIRNAGEQIRALYAAEHTQFPPQGLSMDDSFFAVLSEREDKPARLYAGCMAIGTSPITMMIRVLASLLFGSRYLAQLKYDDRIVDSFWTLTGYFNSLRELGSALVRVVDDIQDRFSYLRTGKFKTIYPLAGEQTRYDRYKELTSREKSENIGEILQNELKIPYKSDGTTNPYDFLLASNMISVGVDVGRLGVMNVIGQPKTTAEYIQATSRVGRETPGLVITNYNQAKSRDRSHYEQFRAYHETFYRFVEATSLTPFSDRARDRALQALYVILCRYLVPELKMNSGAANFTAGKPETENVKQYILDYVKRMDPDEYQHVAEELEDIEQEWQSRTNDSKLQYTNKAEPRNSLFCPDYEEKSRFRIMNSMRSVEMMINVFEKQKKS